MLFGKVCHLSVSWKRADAWKDPLESQAHVKNKETLCTHFLTMKLVKKA